MKRVFKNEKRVFYESDTEVAEALARMVELAQEKAKLTKERTKIATRLEESLIEQFGDDPVYIETPKHRARWYKNSYVSAEWLKKYHRKIWLEARRDTKAYLVISYNKKK